MPYLANPRFWTRAVCTVRAESLSNVGDAIKTMDIFHVIQSITLKAYKKRDVCCKLHMWVGELLESTIAAVRQ